MFEIQLIQVKYLEAQVVDLMHYNHDWHGQSAYPTANPTVLTQEANLTKYLKPRWVRNQLVTLEDDVGGLGNIDKWLIGMTQE